ncbi:MAG: ATP-binding protein [Candidatus Aenigmarchaeota archaeon]|nr:ATP-binding protein [Candidatus Aenigmarchaeota archaeon]
MKREKDFEFVISEWKTFEVPPLIEREIEIPESPSSIVCIAGGRQVGKTYRMFQLIKELLRKGFTRDNILYINFEHERLRNLDANNLEEMMKVFYKLSNVDESKPIYLLLDEVQLVKDWDKWVRRMFDSGNFKIYITGSSSKILGEKIPKSLRGRSIDFILFPFAFTEFLKAKRFKIEKFELLLEKRGKLLKILEEFVTYGSYPKISLIEDQKEKARLLISYYRTVFYKDLVDNYGIENTSALDAFLKYALANFSKYISISKAYNYVKSLGIKSSKQTLIDYLNFSNEIFFLFPMEIFSPSIKARKQYPKKIYVLDNGIITSLFPENKESWGRLMENLVARNLIKETYELPSLKVYYWKEYGKQEGKEVDFVVKEGLKVKQLIQVTYASGLDEIEKRELRSLVKASNLLNCKDLLVITWDYEDEVEFKGKKVKFMPLWKWLLKL